MEKHTTPLEFWNQIWEEGIIRFHQPHYNPLMTMFFKDINLQNKTVLIPLAGKSKDILYFLEKGAVVTAIEFVESAVIDFFNENNMPFEKNGNIYSGKNLTFIAGDFFNFTTMKPFDVLYDRAAQVVFTPTQRPEYYKHLAKLIDPHTLLFLFSVDHKGSPDYGPPHKISKEEIISFYKKLGFTLNLISEKKEVGSEKMQAQGIAEINSFILSTLSSQ